MNIELITNWVRDVSGVPHQHQYRIAVSIAIILVLWLLKRGAIMLVGRETDNPGIRYHWRKAVGYTHLAVLLLLLLRVWFEVTQSFITIFGFLAAGVAIALQDLIKSVAGWIFILWRRPFKVGDRIQIGSTTGDVIDIRFFKFSMVEIGNWVHADQSTGRVLHVPNSLIITNTIINYSEGFQFIWNEIPVMVTFESDWKEAKEMLLIIAKRHAEHITKEAERWIKEASKKYMIFYHKLTPIVYTSVENCGVSLTIRYLIEPRRRRGSEQAIWEDVLTEFAKRDDIDFAYPTQRFYDNVVEGKSNARAVPDANKP